MRENCLQKLKRLSIINGNISHAPRGSKENLAGNIRTFTTFVFVDFCWKLVTIAYFATLETA